MHKIQYEPAPEYTADAYLVKGCRGIAWFVLGWETETLMDPETYEELWDERTGRLVCVMVGDDKRWSIDPDDVTPIKPEDYCPECGQIGCRAGRC